MIYAENHSDPIQVHAYCLRAYKITVPDLTDYIHGKDVPRIDCYDRCVVARLGFVDRSNNINVENIAKYIKVYFDYDVPDEIKTQAETIYQSCKEQISQTDDRCEELKRIGKCLIEQGVSNRILEVFAPNKWERLLNALSLNSHV